MVSYITADEQRNIRSEIEEAQRILQRVFLHLKPLERTDDRVTRTEQAVSAIERLLWTMTSGPGRLGPAAKVRAILTLPGPAPEPGHGGKPFLTGGRTGEKGVHGCKEVQSAHA